MDYDYKVSAITISRFVNENASKYRKIYDEEVKNISYKSDYYRHLKNALKNYYETFDYENTKTWLEGQTFSLTKHNQARNNIDAFEKFYELFGKNKILKQLKFNDTKIRYLYSFDKKNDGIDSKILVEHTPYFVLSEEKKIYYHLIMAKWNPDHVRGLFSFGNLALSEYGGEYGIIDLNNFKIIRHSAKQYKRMPIIFRDTVRSFTTQVLNLLKENELVESSTEEY